MAEFWERKGLVLWYLSEADRYALNEKDYANISGSIDMAQATLYERVPVDDPECLRLQRLINEKRECYMREISLAANGGEFRQLESSVKWRLGRAKMCSGFLNGYQNIKRHLDEAQRELDSAPEEARSNPGYPALKTLIDDARETYRDNIELAAKRHTLLSSIRLSQEAAPAL